LPNWAGSYSSWATMVDFKKMTHLNLAYGDVTAGTNEWNVGVPDSDVQAFVKAAHAANVKVLISIGGETNDLPICFQYNNETNIAPLVENLAALVTRLGLDGVDVDLEHGEQMKSTGNFPEFLDKLIGTLRPQGKLVTAALAQHVIEEAGTDEGVLAWLETYDFINLMIYQWDMDSYVSELDWWTSTTGLAKNKLTWGLQFDPQLSTAVAKQLTTASESYGGVMVWEYSQPSEAQLWPAMQSVL
jgi:chitinase